MPPTTHRPSSARRSTCAQETMHPYRVIVVVGGERTIQIVVPLDHVPEPGEVLPLPDGTSVTVRHVINAQRAGVEGVVLAWDG